MTNIIILLFLCNVFIYEIFRKLMRIKPTVVLDSQQQTKVPGAYVPGGTRTPGLFSLHPAVQASLRRCFSGRSLLSGSHRHHEP